MKMEEGIHKEDGLEFPLIISSSGSHGGFSTTNFDDVFSEVKRLLTLALPLVSVNLLVFALQVISVMFVGHLGELHLSGASLATSFASVTAFSLLIGMSGGLETLCGQSYGAKQYHMLGIHMQRGMVVLLIFSIPLALISANAEHILVLLGQDPEISSQSGSYARFLIPGIFAHAIFQCQVRFLQAQNNVFPIMFVTGITALLHVFTCWILVFESGLGSKGAAFATEVIFQDVGYFLRLAIPSAVMTSMEIWSFEMMVLLSGLLPNPKLETSVLSINLNTCTMVFMLPLGLSGAVSTRVSNELGAGRPDKARLASYTGLCVVHNTCLGTARGCGWQKIGAIINLGAYYLLGIPSGILLAFGDHIGGKGLWLGIIFAIVTTRTDWKEQVKKAGERVHTTSSGGNSTAEILQ